MESHPLAEKLQELEDKYACVKTAIKDLDATMRGIKKEINKITRVHDKKMQKKKRLSQDTIETRGFRKPERISEEMRLFLDLPEGSLLSRAEMTKKIHVYANEKKLKRESNKSEITLNPELQKLFKTDREHIHAFKDLQGFLNPHLLK